MTEILKPDICVIGAGSGGLSVAAAAAAFGVSVVLIEKGKMGGDCLNYGCVPSKAILAAGKHAQAIRDAGKFGVTVSQDPKVDFKKVHDHVHHVIAQIEPNDSVERFTGMGVEVIQAEGRFKDEKTVIAGDKEIQARRFVISTGSSAFIPPIKGLDSVPYLTNETLFENTKKMDHLVIIGGGPIGMEMAQAHRRLGCEVTVLEGAKALGKDDPELTSILLEKLREEDINIIEGALVSNVMPRGKSGITISYKKDDQAFDVKASHVLVATGRAANIDGLSLGAAGIEHTRRGITVSSDLRTTNKRVYAIGDVTGGLQFTHVAGYHAGLVIRGILFRKKAVPNDSMIPWVTYTDPELGHVGMTEDEAREKYGTIKVLRWPYHENDRAQAERKTTGLIKMVTNKKGLILGVSIVGLGAGEMMNMWALAITNKMKVGDVVGYVSPYPTLSEIGKRAAVTNYTSLAKKPMIRSLIKFLQKFG
jgi:pyruvate/2-oxoglutarate dehydrogenase complex dihydrolipoamide dehydrogenase (E3) component